MLQNVVKKASQCGDELGRRWVVNKFKCFGINAIEMRLGLYAPVGGCCDPALNTS